MSDQEVVQMANSCISISQVITPETPVMNCIQLDNNCCAPVSYYFSAVITEMENVALLLYPALGLAPPEYGQWRSWLRQYQFTLFKLNTVQAIPRE